jgi:hypothetical protein
MNANPPADNECGVVVAAERLLGRSDRAAVILRTAVAYTSGARLALTALLRDEADGDAWHDVVTSPGPDGLLLGFQWHPSPPAPLRPPCVPDYGLDIVASPIGAGGGGTHFTITLWVSPLRPEGGDLDLHLSWGRFGIETVTAIAIPDSGTLRAKALILWS